MSRRELFSPKRSCAETGGGPQRDRVTLSTIHGAKGREWPVVCLFDVSQPTGKAPTPDEEEEERGLSLCREFTVRLRCFTFHSLEAVPLRSSVRRLFPDRLHLVSDIDVVAWRRDRYAMVDRLHRDIGASRKLTASLAEEKAELKSGRDIEVLKHAYRRAVERRDSLQDQFIEIGKKRPANLFARLFRGGSSAAQLFTKRQAVGQQILIAERTAGSSRRE